MTDLMVQANPPAVQRGRKPNAKVKARRDQLHQHPNTWFVWQDNAKNASYARKTACQLLGIRQGDKFSMGKIPYEFRTVRNTTNSCYTLYVRYVPTKGQQ